MKIIVPSAYPIAFPRIEAWTLHRLPAINRAILARDATPEKLIDEVLCGPLRETPVAATLSDWQAKQWVVYLGLIGSSVARHMQERDLALKAHPARAFDQLTTSDGIPFLAYMELIAQRTNTGHAARDTYASLVRWNAPNVEVSWQGTTYATIPGVFASDAIRTYTGSAGEALFIELLKKAEALEAVVNGFLFLPDSTYRRDP